MGRRFYEHDAQTRKRVVPLPLRCQMFVAVGVGSLFQSLGVP